MQTKLADFIKGTPDGDEAEAILRACVHCGFCTATCPTYQVLGDELDGPRGRIYLIKQVLEGAAPTEKTQQHLDRCLTCLNCESTCPSGVRYGRLIDIGRRVVEERVPRPAAERTRRALLKEGLTRKWLFSPAYKLGQAVAPLLSPGLQDKLIRNARAGTWPRRSHARKMLLLDGCVQPAMAPNINAATARVLDALGVELLVVPQAGCCGAVRYHMNDQVGGLDDARRNIDAWWPRVQEAECILTTASGCGLMVKEYGELLRHDAAYAAKAKRISDMARDLSEVLPEFTEPLANAMQGKLAGRVAWHPPCTLQHGQRIRGKVEDLLRAVGVDVVLCAESHLCCGSAGTYSVLQPELSRELRDRKVHHLEATGAPAIVSANIGCISHLQSGTRLPVTHWIELIDRALSS